MNEGRKTWAASPTACATVLDPVFAWYIKSATTLVYKQGVEYPLCEAQWLSGLVTRATAATPRVTRADANAEHKTSSRTRIPCPPR